MYRRVAWVLLVAIFALAVWQAYRVSAPDIGAAKLSLPAFLRLPPARTNLGNLFIEYANNLILLLVGAGLAWAAAFHPGRRHKKGAVMLKLGAVALASLFAVMVLYEKAMVLGTGAAVLAQQMDRSPAVVLAVYGAPHSVPRVFSLLLVLSAPVFWFVRSLRVGSLPRSTFEAWVEVKRLILPAALLLGVATFIEVYVTPAITTWLLGAGS